MLGHDPERPGPEFRERIGVVLQQSELWPNLTVRETHAIFAGYYRAPRDVDEVIALVGLRGEGERAGQDALGRPEAAARPRHRARRRSRPRLPRRADDGLRPAGAPRGVGDDPLAPLARQDRPAHDALPRRGRAARRPRRGDARGADRARRDAARADDAPTCRPRSATGRTARRCSCGRRADARARRADVGGASRAARSSRASRCGGRRSRRSTSRSPPRTRGGGRGMSAEAIRVVGPAPAARGSSSTSSARSSSSSGAAARPRSSSSSSRCCSSCCSARSTRGSSKACRSPGRSSPGSSATGARTPRSPASRSSSSCGARAGSSSGSARRLCRLRPTSPRSSPRR